MALLIEIKAHRPSFFGGGVGGRRGAWRRVGCPSYLERLTLAVVNSNPGLDGIGVLVDVIKAVHGHAGLVLLGVKQTGILLGRVEVVAYKRFAIGVVKQNVGYGWEVSM
ncbi:MAG: hypothetical protein AAFX99_26335 [Myxococcota bacterium]